LAVKNAAAEYRKRIRKEKDMERHITVPVVKEENTGFKSRRLCISYGSYLYRP